MASYKLIYFNARALAEPIRLLFAYGGVKYEDVRFEEEEWKTLKPKTPYGKVPMLEIDGVRYSQSIALTNHVARCVKLAGDSEVEALAAEGAALFIYDMIALPEDIIFRYSASLGEAGVKTEINNYLESTLPSYLEKFEAIVADNGGFFVAGKLTWADVYFMSMMEYLQAIFAYSKMDFDEKFLENYAALGELIEHVRNVESIKRWIEERPKTEL